MTEKLLNKDVFNKIRSASVNQILEKILGPYFTYLRKKSESSFSELHAETSLSIHAIQNVEAGKDCPISTYTQLFLYYQHYFDVFFPCKIKFFELVVCTILSYPKKRE